MKTKVVAVLAAALAAAAFGSGCASRTSVAEAGPTKSRYLYLPPETGSHIGRRVLVNPDGTIATPTSSVKQMRREDFEELQRRGAQNLSGSR